MHFRLHLAELRATDIELAWEVDAPTAADAKDKGRAAGYYVASVEPLPEHGGDAEAVMLPGGVRRQRLWGSLLPAQTLLPVCQAIYDGAGGVAEDLFVSATGRSPEDAKEFVRRLSLHLRETDPDGFAPP